MKKHHASSTARNLIPCEKCSYVTDLIALATKHAALHLRFVNCIVILVSIYCLNTRNCIAIYRLRHICACLSHILLISFLKVSVN